MPSHIDVRGASGAFYRFRPADDPRARSTMSGNYVYVRGEELVFLGETDNLMIGAADRWQEAASAYGTDGIYIRPIVARATRSDEQRDILRAQTPPMNEPLAEEAETEAETAALETEAASVDDEPEPDLCAETDFDLAIPEPIRQLI